MKTYLETSALITLHFRNEQVAAACRQHLPPDAEPVVTRYVIFELARGYLTSLREMHAEACECRTRYDLRAMVKAHGRRHTYKGPTWTDALDDDLFVLEREQEPEPAELPWQQQLPEMFQARLRQVIFEGWDACQTHYPLENPAGCRADLPPPREDAEGRLQHDLPTAQCGTAGNCGVLAYVRAHRGDFAGMHAQQGGLKLKRKAPERARRVEGMAHLLGATGEDFEGGQCHSCADAIIAHEARGHAVATKDGDLKPLCKVCGTKMVPVPHR